MTMPIFPGEDHSREFNIRCKADNPVFNQEILKIYQSKVVPLLPVLTGKAQSRLEQHNEIFMWDLFTRTTREPNDNRLRVPREHAYYSPALKVTPKGTKGMIRIAQRKFQFGHNPNNITNDYMIMLTDAYEAAGLILRIDAILNVFYTRWEPTPKFVEEFYSITDMMYGTIDAPKVYVRQNDDKNLHADKKARPIVYNEIDYPDIPFAHYNRVMDAWNQNKINTTFDIVGIKNYVDTRDTYSERIYYRGSETDKSQNFKYGGRIHHGFHDGGANGLRKEDRKYITFDGAKNVEVDIVACHVSLIYCLNNMSPPVDPYYIFGELGEHDDRKKIEEMRANVKLLILKVFNAETRKDAYDSFRNDLRIIAKLEGKKFNPKVWPDELLDAMVNAFVSVNPATEEYIAKSDAGLKLMTLDGQIAFEVVEKLTERDIVPLSCHDSFLVAEQHLDILIRTVRDAITKVVGINTGVQVKYYDRIAEKQEVVCTTKLKDGRYTI
jgi:hypothetical protein